MRKMHIVNKEHKCPKRTSLSPRNGQRILSLPCMNQQTWGDALKIRSSQVGLRTHKELASLLGANITTVQRWMNADTYPNLRSGFDVALMHALRLTSLHQLKKLPQSIASVPIEPNDDPPNLSIAALTLELINRGVPQRLIHETLEAMHDNEVERRKRQEQDEQTDDAEPREIKLIEPQFQRPDGHTEQRIKTYEATDAPKNKEQNEDNDRDVV